MTRILVTGATGLIGSNLLMRLLGRGLAEDKVRIRATLYNDSPVVVDREIEYAHADLTKEADCASIVEDCDVVVHAAASTSGAAVIQQTPLVHVIPNIAMNAFMLNAAYDAGVKKFIWFASTTGYPPGSYPMLEEEMFDDEPFEKYFGVGHMKRYTEKLCQLYGEKLVRTMTTVVLRPSNIYGKNDDYDFETSHVTASLIRKVIERHNPIIVWGNGKDLRDTIFVDDVIDAVMCAIASEKKGYNAYNIGLGKVHSVNAILRKLLKLDGYEGARIEHDKSKPTMIPVRRVDISKAKRELGFVAKTSLDEGLRKTIEWYRANRL